MGQILEGMRVVDFGQYVAGPLTAMFLADQGADVVRVDPPGGPRWDTPANAVWNRGKRRITLDLKDAEDLATARRLIAGADVVVENFRPGVMDRLGVGAEAMTAAAPRLVYCSLPGFASDDPRAALPAWEGVVAAATGTYRSRTGEGASFTAIPIASTFAALVAATSIASALFSRERDGRGQRIEVPLFEFLSGVAQRIPTDQFQPQAVANIVNALVKAELLDRPLLDHLSASARAPAARCCVSISVASAGARAASTRAEASRTTSVRRWTTPPRGFPASKSGGGARRLARSWE